VKKSTLVTVAVVLLLGAIVVANFLNRVPVAQFGSPPGKPKSKAAVATTATPAEPATAPTINRPPPPEPGSGGPLSADEKAARIEKIKSDYDDIRTKAARDYGAAGAAFPGGLRSFLRQLALLEREKRADFATVLSPRELEDLELRETLAGQLVQRLLGKTDATDEQRRAAFRLQRDFEDRFALHFDVAPAALLERETARQHTQEKIRAALGDELFGAWLAGEGGDYANFVAYVSRQNLPPSASLELWRAKNEYILRRHELIADQTLSPEQQAAAQKAAIQQTETRVAGIIGPGPLQTARADVLRWLPKK
jgi:hypothetical protein